MLQTPHLGWEPSWMNRSSGSGVEQPGDEGSLRLYVTAVAGGEDPRIADAALLSAHDPWADVERLRAVPDRDGSEFAGADAEQGHGRRRLGERLEHHVVALPRGAE